MTVITSPARHHTRFEVWFTLPRVLKRLCFGDSVYTFKSAIKSSICSPNSRNLEIYPVYRYRYSVGIVRWRTEAEDFLYIATWNFRHNGYSRVLEAWVDLCVPHSDVVILR
jgi:hypothetical protein